MRHVRSLLASLSLAGVAACSAPHGDAPAAAPRPPAQARSAYVRRAVAAGGTVASADEHGVPRFIWARDRQPAAKGASPEAMARRHFARFAAAYGVEGEAIDRVGVASLGRLRGGSYLARLRQEVDGVEVYPSEVNVVMRPDLSLAALSGAPSRVTGTRPENRRFLLSPGDALGMALGHLYGVPVPAGTVAADQPAHAGFVPLVLQQSSPVRLSRPARAKKVYYPAGDSLVPAYFIEFFSSRDGGASSDAFRYLVAAGDGRILERQDLVLRDSYTYRVYAAEDGRPLDGPIADYTPHPAGAPDGSEPHAAASRLVSTESFKRLPAGVVDPWLPPGATQTRGNNVDAYTDSLFFDGFSPGDFRATTTGAGTFDHAFDLTREPDESSAQTMAAITNAFYVLNWLHDYWYDSGFDEAAGNAQADNYGRRGLGNDPILLEVQDFDGLNNANMATPSDGFSPRMQMYLWTPPERNSVTVDPDGAAVSSAPAGFGPQTFELSGELVLAVDATEPSGDACHAIVNDVAGKIVLIDRGLCSFASKAQKAQAAGAAAVLIANTEPGPAPGLGNQVPPLDVAIPAFGIDLEGGDLLKARLGEGPTIVRMSRRSLGTHRDGSLDNLIMAHEWGHYLHMRNDMCFGRPPIIFLSVEQCFAASEGFGDFVALHMAVREGDDLEHGTYAVGIYAPRNVGDSGYFGVRRFPYSVDFAKNALTFKHIEEGPLPDLPQNPNGIPNWEVHNAGEIWASMLFEAYVAVHRNSQGRRSFEETRRAFADYLVLALQLAPDGSTFIDYRDSLLAAIEILDPDQVEVVAQAFARRGAGTCAVGPDPFDFTNANVVESFDVSPIIGEASISLDDSVTSCDDDGTLDAGETGLVTVTVENRGPAVMSGTRVTVSTDHEGVTFPDGPTVTLDDIPRLGTGTGVVKIALDGSVAEADVLQLSVAINNAAACVPQATVERSVAIQRDELPESSRTDDVEALASPWTTSGTGAAVIWSRQEIDATEHVWHGAGSASVSDAALVSPPLHVGADPFRVSFAHAFSFDYANSAYWDGGVIEISQDDGATWLDVTELGADPGYSASAIAAGTGNPLAGRPAYGRANLAYPATETVSLDFGTALAGKTVRLRFRIGTDDAVGSDGWRVDDIAVEGTDNEPFTAVAPRATCQRPPVADAGSDVTAQSSARVTLSALASSDPDGGPLAFAWTQTAGRPVSLSDPSAAQPTFTAPEVSAPEDLVFQVQVSDGKAQSTDSVTVHVVRPAKPETGASGDGGCAIARGSGGAAALPLLVVLGLAALSRRRRRLCARLPLRPGPLDF